MRSIPGCASALFAGVLALSGVARAQSAADCAALATLPVQSTTITGTALVLGTALTPEYCRVLGHVDTEINFELRLPTAWNGKFLFGGEGGLAGQISDQTGLQAGGEGGLQRGYAVAFSDTGHKGVPPPGATSPVYDGSWAWQNPERQVNWAHRSTHVVSVAAKAIVTAYYRQAPLFSYFSGCSGGGRQAAMTAQRYANDFDGILSGAPFLSVTGQAMGWNWAMQALAQNPIAPSKLVLLAPAVRAACDANDGLVDGLVSDPRRCKFDPWTLACGSTEGPNCLTARELDSVLKIYRGPSTSSGERLFPGFVPGAEDTQWPRALVHTVTGGPGELGALLPDQIIRYFALGPDFDSMTFEFDVHPAALAAAAELLDVKPDLSAFRAAGGKMLMYHGWNDPRLTPWLSIQYRDAVIHNIGGGPERTDEFFRLFMAPEMGHCGGGPGPNSFDALTALELWVEHGIAPTRLIATHQTSTGTVDRSRPLCVYPKVATYDGSGSIDDASNFVCEDLGLVKGGVERGGLRPGIP
jgi:feruloyl esterase